MIEIFIYGPQGSGKSKATYVIRQELDRLGIKYSITETNVRPNIQPTDAVSKVRI